MARKRRAKKTSLRRMVGAERFELSTSCSQSRRSTRLSYTPNEASKVAGSAALSTTVCVRKAWLLPGSGALVWPRAADPGAFSRRAPRARTPSIHNPPASAEAGYTRAVEHARPARFPGTARVNRAGRRPRRAPSRRRPCRRGTHARPCPRTASAGRSDIPKDSASASPPEAGVAAVAR